MEIVSRESVAFVELFNVRLSEDEVAVYEAAITHLLASPDAAEIERRCGASREELEAMRDDLRRALAPRETPTLV